jgi:hypothetical protein
MIPGTYNLPSVTEGDTWVGVPSITIAINGDPPASSLARVAMQFRRRHTDADALVSLHSGSGGGITIDDAAGWEIAVPPQVLTLDAGSYVYDLETEDATGVIRTYLAGRLTVLPQVTR